MASFDPNMNTAKKKMGQQYPIKRLEPAVHKFEKILQIDLERMHQHKLNMLKFQIEENWEALNREQINASRTVQQLQSNIKELEKTRAQVLDTDLDKFDKLVNGIRQKAILGVISFFEENNLDGTTSLEHSYNDKIIQKPCDNIKSGHTNTDLKLHVNPTIICNDRRTYSLEDLLTETQIPQHQTQVNLPQDSRVEESWNSLKQDLVELNTTIQDFSSLVHDQQSQVDRIEDNIEKSADNVVEGVKHLSKATKYKAAMIPVAGALLGGIVGGPIGLLAGAKIGALASIGGGIIGLTGGQLLKKRQKKIVDIELQNLSRKRSYSEPDVSQKIIDK